MKPLSKLLMLSLGIRLVFISGASGDPATPGKPKIVDNDKGNNDEFNGLIIFIAIITFFVIMCTCSCCFYCIGRKHDQNPIVTNLELKRVINMNSGDEARFTSVVHYTSES